ncbi:cation:dicarboxylase symporter family transporter, partial [Georgenia sp. 10Sc9-8]|nr:cation:dicarboxylase symporter family transporter [Georgenia halotolerans]
MSSSSSTPTRSRRRLRAPSFTAQILLALVLGVLLGWAALAIGTGPDGQDNALTVTLSTIGSTFVTLLKATVPPLVFTAIVASIANLRGVANAARLAGQTLLWFAITALASVSVAMVLGLLLRPGQNTSVPADAAAEPGRTGSW